MTPRDDSSGPSDRGDDALRKLVEQGGAVWAFKMGEGSILELTYAEEREGAAIITGRVLPEVLAHDFDPDREGTLLPSGEEMLSHGWVDSKNGGIERTWAVRTRLDRSNLRRDVDRAVAVLAEARGKGPDSYPLTYRPPGETDAGSGEAGCLFAVPSAFVGDAIGAIWALLSGEPLPFVVALAIFAYVTALTIGFVAIGTVLPRVLARIPSLRSNAESTGTGAMLIIPGIVALLAWPVVPMIGLRDPGTLMGASVLLVVAAVVLPLPWMVASLVRKR